MPSSTRSLAKCAYSEMPISQHLQNRIMCRIFLHTTDIEVSAIGREPMEYLDAVDDVIGLDKVGDLDSIEKRLSVLSERDISSFCRRLSETLPRPTAGTGSFRYVANSALSGLPYPCGGMSCRSKNVSEVANFAALYADQVVLFDPFQRLIWLRDRPDQTRVLRASMFRRWHSMSRRS